MEYKQANKLNTNNKDLKINTYRNMLLIGNLAEYLKFSFLFKMFLAILSFLREHL